MPAVLLYKFTIAGTDVTNYVLEGTNISLERDNISGNTANVVLDNSVSNVLTISAGQEVVITRGAVVSTEKTIFKGNIKIIDYEEAVIEVTVTDPLQKLKYNLFTESFDRNVDPEAGELSAIFTTIAEEAGFTVNAQSSGVGSGSITVDKFIARKSKRLERMRAIAKILDWFFYYNYGDDEIVFQPKGTVVYPNPLIVGENVANLPKWEQDIESMRNVITIEGITETDTREQSYTGDGTTKTYSFDYTPETTELTVDGVLQVRGVDNSTTDFDYTVDSELKTWTFVNAPSVSASIEMKYTTNIPKPVTVTSPVSISTYGVEQEETYSFSDVATVEDGKVRAQQILNILENGDINAQLDTDEYNINVGDLVEVQDSRRPLLSGDYIVQKKIINYPDIFDSIVIGTEDITITDLFKTLDERISDLEQSDNQIDQILLQVVSLALQSKFKIRDFAIETKDAEGVGFILDHTRYGFAGLNFFGKVNEISDENFLQQGNSTYQEYFVDTQYIDTINTTATVNTTTKTVSFTSGQVLQTELIYNDEIGSSIVNSVNANITKTSGSFLIEASVDNGSTWETVSIGTTSLLSNSGNKLLLRITENGGSTGVITFLSCAMVIS